MSEFLLLQSRMIILDERIKTSMNTSGILARLPSGWKEKMLGFMYAKAIGYR